MNAIKASGRQRTQCSELRIALTNHTKHLGCLYSIARVIHCQGHSLEAVLQGVIDQLPAAWQYPEICCARLTLRDRRFTTANFRESLWRMSAEVAVESQREGEIEVFYWRRPRCEAQEFFLHGERTLLGAVAQRVGEVVGRARMERQLHAEGSALQEANAAIRAILARIDEEKRAIYSNVAENVKRVLMPILHALEKELPARQHSHVVLLRKHLEEIASPLVRTLSCDQGMLTPTEIQVCDLIHNGYSSKEIAQLRGVCVATVNKQREHIRRKLSLHGTSKNLASHLGKLIAART